MTTARTSPSPSPPPTAPVTTTDQTTPHSHRFLALRKVYTSALRATLATNSYPNFASCFPTPATYCPRALEGVWKQLNTRLEEECTRDFDKICIERDVETGLGTWEELISEAKVRKTEAEAEAEGHDAKTGAGEDIGARRGGGQGEKAMHLLSAQDLYSAHLTPTLVKAESELQGKLESVQEGNREMAGKIVAQRAEMQRLIEVLEGMVEDVEGAAEVVEGEGQDLRMGVLGLDGGGDGDVKMGG